MLYGHPMSGKTTAAARIQSCLRKIGILAEIIGSAKSRLKGKVHSSTTGFVDEGNARTRSAKDKAYRSVCNAAVKCLRRNVVPVLDATFHKLYRREWVYALAKSEGAAVYLVWLVFNDEKAIKRSMKERREAGKVSALHTWGQYAIMRQQADRLEDNELVKRPGCLRAIVQLNRDKGAVRVYGKADGFTTLLADAVMKQPSRKQVAKDFPNI